jgi:hypothetical protein
VGLIFGRGGIEAFVVGDIHRGGDSILGGVDDTGERKGYCVWGSENCIYAFDLHLSSEKNPGKTKAFENG